MNVCPVMVGRERELSQLEDALALGGLILVAGEAGIGKSRLLREVAIRAEGLKRTVVWGRPEVVTTPGPYSLITDLLDDVADVGRAADARDLADVLAAAGSADQPARQVAARVRALLGGLRAPVVMIEDLHGADELSQAVVAHLARSAPDDGVLVVATYRPEESAGGGLARLLDVLHRDRIVRQIDLSSLDAEASRRMLEAMWGRAPTPDELAEIDRLGDGVPFFIEELAGARIEGASSIPGTIARAVNARLSRLDARAQSVVKAASLMLGSVDPAVLADVCRVPESEIPHALIDAVSVGMLGDREGRLVFRHGLIRDTVADGIVSVERTEMHARIAEAIERIHAEQLDQHAAALARHHEGAGHAEHASRWWVKAGNRALAASAIQEARDCFAAARVHATLQTEIEVKAGEAGVAVRVGEWDLAVKLLGEVVEGYRASARMLEASTALARLASVKATLRDPTALASFDEALSLVDRGDPAYARLVIEKGYALTRNFEDAERGEPVLVEGRRSAEASGDLELQGKALEGLAWVAEFRGSGDEARVLGDKACDLAFESGNDELIIHTHMNQALRLALRGWCREALVRLDQAREHLVATGVGGKYIPTIDHSRAWVLWRMGMPEEADRYAARCEETRWAKQYGRVVRAWAAWQRGDAKMARSIISAWWDEMGGKEMRARALASPEEASDESPDVVMALLGDLVIHISEGAVSEELLRASAAFADLCRTANQDIASLAMLLHARALIALGDTQRALGVIAQAEPSASQYPLHAAAVIELRGLASDDGAEIFHQAAEAYARAENTADMVRCRRLQAERMAARGDTSEAIAILKVAREMAGSVGAVEEVSRCEAALRSLGVRPRAGRPKGSGARRNTLSNREEEVVVLVAAGATNAEIASRLFLSERTVEVHLANAQKRLGVSGRTGLVAWAVKQGLI